MRRLIRAALVLSAVTLLAQCQGPAEPGTRGECERCDQDNGNADCVEGLVCSGFFNSQLVLTLCANPGQSSCDFSLGQEHHTVIAEVRGP